jgi:hypothetical protein
MIGAILGSASFSVMMVPETPGLLAGRFTLARSREQAASLYERSLYGLYGFL